MQRLYYYPSTLANANSSLSTLFSEMLKFSNFISSKSKDIVKENNEYLGNISFVEMDIPKLINYSTDMC